MLGNAAASSSSRSQAVQYPRHNPIPCIRDPGFWVLPSRNRMRWGFAPQIASYRGKFWVRTLGSRFAPKGHGSTAMRYYLSNLLNNSLYEITSEVRKTNSKCEPLDFGCALWVRSSHTAAQIRCNATMPFNSLKDKYFNHNTLLRKLTLGVRTLRFGCAA